MNGEIETIGSAQSEWSVNRMGQIVDKSFFVVIFVAVWLIGGNFPSSAVKVYIKLGKFILDGNLAELGLGWNFITESYGIVKYPDAESKNAPRVFVFGEIKSCFIIIIGNELIFAPLELDGFGMFGFLLANKFEIVAQGLFPGDKKTKSRRLDHDFVVFINRIINMARF